MKNIKKYILGFLATLMLCITSVVEINNTQNDIVVNAEESSDMVYVGTPINPTGTISNVYFNTSLTSDEIISIFDSINFPIVDGVNLYIVFADESGDNGITILKALSNDEYVYTFNATLDGEDYRLIYANQFDNFVSSLVFNNIIGIPMMFNNPVGQQNDLISSLVSSTPFYRVIKDNPTKNQSMIGGLFGALTTGLTGIINPIIKGIENGFNEMFISGGDSFGTAINPTGTYNKFYFNTALSVDDVVSILEKLDYFDSGEGYLVNYAFLKSDGMFGLFIMKIPISDTESIFAISLNNNGNIMLFASADDSTTGLVAGWQQFNNPLTFDSVTGIDSFTDDEEIIPIGQQNELLSSLISGTPFESNQTLTPLGIFLIGMFGLAIGFGLIWLIISIFKHRK